MTKEQAVFWLLLLRFNPDNNVLPNEVIDIAIGAIVSQPEKRTETHASVSTEGGNGMTRKDILAELQRGEQNEL